MSRTHDHCNCVCGDLWPALDSPPEIVLAGALPRAGEVNNMYAVSLRPNRLSLRSGSWVWLAWSSFADSHHREHREHREVLNSAAAPRGVLIREGGKRS